MLPPGRHYFGTFGQLYIAVHMWLLLSSSFTSIEVNLNVCKIFMLLVINNTTTIIMPISYHNCNRCKPLLQLILIINIIIRNIITVGTNISITITGKHCCNIFLSTSLSTKSSSETSSLLSSALASQSPSMSSLQVKE